MDGSSFDVIVVGGGSAGCVVASRLSEDPARRVLLLEGGPDPIPLPELVADASLQARQLLEGPYLSMYPTRRELDGSTFHLLAGRIMGGGSSVNFMDALRPLAYDCDLWASAGCEDWSYARLLPRLRAIEADHDFPSSDVHGAEGPIWIERAFNFEMSRSALTDCIIDQSMRLGLPLCPDMNVADPYGVCVPPTNIRNGRRQSATVAYLDSARLRPNLTITAEATALELMTTGQRATGVRYQHDGSIRVARADRIVLSAGVFHTPLLLMRSGIGPAGDLASAGVRVVCDLSGVGENYQDHAVVYMNYRGRDNTDEELALPRLRILTKSDPSHPCPNIHIIPRQPTSVRGLGRIMSMSVHLLEQQNRGRVTLAAHTHDEFVIESRMLEHRRDSDAITSAMELVDDLVGGRAMRRFYGSLILPRPKDDWSRFARETHDSYHHGAGTCRMGAANDELAVVDQRLRVRGFENLWIADASVLPSVTHSNLNLTAMLIGELASNSVALEDKA